MLNPRLYELNLKKEFMESIWKKYLKSINPINNDKNCWYIRLRDWFLCYLLRILIGTDKYCEMISKAFVEYSISDLVDESNAVCESESFLKEEIVFKNVISNLRKNGNFEKINHSGFVKEFKSMDSRLFGLGCVDFQIFIQNFHFHSSHENQKNQLLEWITSNQNGYIHEQIKNTLVYPYIYSLFEEQGLMYKSRINSKSLLQLIKGDTTVDDLVNDCIKDKPESVKKEYELIQNDISIILQKKCSPQAMDLYVDCIFILYFSYVYNINTVNRLIMLKKQHNRIIHF